MMMSSSSGRLGIRWSCAGSDASVSSVRCTRGCFHIDALYTQPNFAWCFATPAVAPPGFARSSKPCRLLMSTGKICAFGKYSVHAATDGAVSSPMPTSRIERTPFRIEPKTEWYAVW